ncbi:MAG: hypothetical protein KAJ29_06545 [Alphaproteobacteria bacterium]|nr:hypothetical protein [Alphaproteobacteria bacterium]
MCWSGEASFVVASIGFATTGYAVYKGESPRLYLALGYFSLMELLQGYTYFVINSCALPSNQIATLLGYFHITFQPFFINLLSMYFIPDRIRLKIQYSVYGACFISSVFMLLQLYPFEWAGLCVEGNLLCGKHLCSVEGDWHIAWEIPLNGLTNFIANSPFSYLVTTFPSYVFVGFLLPILYGSWRLTLYHFTVGPLLACLLTDNFNEMPAVWCLLSIGILVLVVKTPLRKYMFVRKWCLWPKSMKAG